MTATGGASLTTTHGVIDGIHCNTADAGTTTQPTVAAGFAKALVLVFVVADLTDGGTALGVQVTDFTGW